MSTLYIKLLKCFAYLQNQRYVTFRSGSVWYFPLINPWFSCRPQIRALIFSMPTELLELCPSQSLHLTKDRHFTMFLIYYYPLCFSSSNVGWIIILHNYFPFHWHNPSDRAMALGSTQPLTQLLTGRVKGKAVPLEACNSPEVSRKLRFPDFIPTAQDGGKVVSLTHRPPLPPGNAPGTHIYWVLCFLNNFHLPMLADLRFV